MRKRCFLQNLFHQRPKWSNPSYDVNHRWSNVNNRWLNDREISNRRAIRWNDIPLSILFFPNGLRAILSLNCGVWRDNKLFSNERVDIFFHASKNLSSYLSLSRVSLRDNSFDISNAYFLSRHFLQSIIV